MNLLTRSYFLRNKWLTILGLICGLTAALLFGLWPKYVGVLFGLFAVQPFLASPYTLRTKIGRIWWLAYACLYAGLIATYFVGLGNLVGLASAIICGVAAAVAVCLRWKPPTDFVNRQKKQATDGLHFDYSVISIFGGNSAI